VSRIEVACRLLWPPAITGTAIEFEILEQPSQVKTAEPEQIEGSKEEQPPKPE